MPAQGWFGDPFGVHEDRWFSGGQPTSLVRDRGAESRDEPPPGQLPGPLVPAAAGPPAPVPARRRFPARPRYLAPDWPAWTLIPPCVLSVLVAAGGVVLGIGGALVSVIATMDTPGQTPGDGRWITASIAGGGIAMLAVWLVAALGWASARLRRFAVPAAWVIVVLQAVWILLADNLSASH